MFPWSFCIFNGFSLPDLFHTLSLQHAVRWKRQTPNEVLLHLSSWIRDLWCQFRARGGSKRDGGAASPCGQAHRLKCVHQKRRCLTNHQANAKSITTWASHQQASASISYTFVWPWPILTHRRQSLLTGWSMQRGLPIDGFWLPAIGAEALHGRTLLIGSKTWRGSHGTQQSPRWRCLCRWLAEAATPKKAVPWLKRSKLHQGFKHLQIFKSWRLMSFAFIN